MFLALRFTLSI